MGRKFCRFKIRKAFMPEAIMLEAMEVFLLLLLWWITGEGGVIITVFFIKLTKSLFFEKGESNDIARSKRRTGH